MPTACTAHPAPHGLAAQEDGSLILRFRESGQFEIIRWVLRWGEDIGVLEPLALHQAVAQHLQDAARHYTRDMLVSAAEME